MGIEFIDFNEWLINIQHIIVMKEYKSDCNYGLQMYYIRTVDDAVYRCQKSVVSEDFKRFYNSKSNRINSNLEERIDKLEKDLLEKYQELENHIKFLPIVSQEYLPLHL